MANNYLLFSDALVGLTEDQANWARDRLKYLDMSPVDLKDVYGQPALDRIKEDGYTFEESDDGHILDFQWEVDAGPDGEWSVWFGSEEFGNIDHVVLFVQEFLTKWRPNGVFALSWAQTCSSARIGDFGGGAVVVTADEAQYMNAWSWVQETVDLLCRQGKAIK